MINRQRLAILALLTANYVEAFTFISPRNSVSNNMGSRSFKTYSSPLKEGEEEIEQESGMNFNDAAQQIKDEEDAERAGARGNGLDEVSVLAQWKTCRRVDHLTLYFCFILVLLI